MKLHRFVIAGLAALALAAPGAHAASKNTVLHQWSRWNAHDVGGYFQPRSLAIPAPAGASCDYIAFAPAR